MWQACRPSPSTTMAQRMFSISWRSRSRRSATTTCPYAFTPLESISVTGLEDRRASPDAHRGVRVPRARARVRGMPSLAATCGRPDHPPVGSNTHSIRQARRTGCSVRADRRMYHPRQKEIDMPTTQPPLLAGVQPINTLVPTVPPMPGAARIGRLGA